MLKWIKQKIKKYSKSNEYIISTKDIALKYMNEEDYIYVVNKAIENQKCKKYGLKI